MNLDGVLPPDHRAPIVWECVEGLDLGPLDGPIKAGAGPATGQAGVWWFTLAHTPMRTVRLRRAAGPAGRGAQP